MLLDSNRVENYFPILDLQSIPRESNNKDVAAMLDELTIEANEESFVIVHQHGGNDVTACKSRIEIRQHICCCIKSGNTCTKPQRKAT